MSRARFRFDLFNQLGMIQDEEFKVAYFILNRLALENTDRVKIYRAMLADLTGKSERTISRITDRLDEKKIIKKDVVSDSKNRYNYYSIHPEFEQSVTQNNTKLGHTLQQIDQNSVTDDTFNKTYKSNKKQNNYNTYKSEKIAEVEFCETGLDDRNLPF